MRARRYHALGQVAHVSGGRAVRPQGSRSAHRVRSATSSERPLSAGCSQPRRLALPKFGASCAVSRRPPSTTAAGRSLSPAVPLGDAASSISLTNDPTTTSSSSLVSMGFDHPGLRGVARVPRRRCRSAPCVSRPPTRRASSADGYHSDAQQPSTPPPWAPPVARARRHQSAAPRLPTWTSESKFFCLGASM